MTTVSLEVNAPHAKKCVFRNTNTRICKGKKHAAGPKNHVGRVTKMNFKGQKRAAGAKKIHFGVKNSRAQRAKKCGVFGDLQGENAKKGVKNRVAKTKLKLFLTKFIISN